MENVILCEVCVPILNKIEINFTCFPVDMNNYSNVEASLTLLSGFSERYARFSWNYD